MTFLAMPSLQILLGGDPLAGISIPDHPVPRALSELNSELSSTPVDTERGVELRSDAHQVLAVYVQRDDKDDTPTVLRIFLAKLPKDGRVILMGEILDLGTDGETQALTQLTCRHNLKAMYAAATRRRII